MSDADPFRRDHAPTPGRVERFGEDLRVVTAPNASPMTFTGTRSFILGRGGVAVVDPGPALEGHLMSLEAALEPGEWIEAILVTHAHVDHTPAARVLAHRHGAPVLAFGDARAGMSPVMERIDARALGGGEGVDTRFRPDRRLIDGERVAGRGGWALRAIHTPGHMGNHLCFHWEERGLVFSGDHVMGWATTLVSPPDGDLTAFMDSLDRIEARAAGSVLHPGHGAPVDDPVPLIRYIREHRRLRENQIVDALGQGAATPLELTAALYRDVPATLHPAASRNVLAHLVDLTERGLVQPDDAPGLGTRFSLVRRRSAP
ncbi:MAG: MBL fold metallo-hydrolase [Rubricella sp.]